ncbi:MAG TPA: YSC84-related protein [Paraburkholderia sp.]|nr:YSC84-related protein [Paraburkholderia sp.]
MLRLLMSALVILLVLLGSAARADEYTDTINLFKNAGESGSLLESAYGYAVFPTVGKGGAGIGGAHGKGRVYEKGKHIGDTTMTQLTVGLQLGGQVYSELIVFENEQSLKQFTEGNFEFGADANAIAITAAAGAKAGTTGTSANVSAGKKDAKTAGGYRKGVAVFTVAKGGLMYEASIGGQKFSYKPR